MLSDILARTISIFDIYDVVLLSPSRDKGGRLAWPIAISGVPPSRLSTGQDAVFIRDPIDAMTSYFQYDLDDCIRKVITSLENCFSHYELNAPLETRWERIKARIVGRRTKIRKLVNEYVKEGRYAYSERDLKILRENILFIYGIRNLVVHDKLRINPSQTTVCRKAIGTLLYLFQGNFLSGEHRVYIFSFYGQFLSLGTQHSGYSLEGAEWNARMFKRRKRLNTIQSPKDMDKWMFQGLKITKRERRNIRSGIAEQHLPPQERV